MVSRACACTASADAYRMGAGALVQSGNMDFFDFGFDAVFTLNVN
jgi:hypothetical protein